MSGTVAPPPASGSSGTFVRPGSPEAQQQRRAQLQAGLRGPVPHFYINSFGLAVTPTDVAVIMVSNGNPVGTINLSYPMVKQLIDELQKTINNIEAATGQEIKAAQAIGEGLQKILGQTGAVIP